MKTLRIITCLIAVVCGMATVSAESRFFKPNSVRILYLWSYSFYNPYLSDSGYDGPWSSEKKWHQAEMWIGNDTIFDGYSCVSLWDRDIDSIPNCIGFIREDDDGLVWRYELTSRFVYPPDDGKYQWVLDDFGVRNNWVFLYDFSNPDWKKGTEIKAWPISLQSGYEVRTMNSVSSIWFQDGTQAAVFDLYHIIYGIGTLHCPFEGSIVQCNSDVIAHVLEYWRDGVLLIKNDAPTSLESPIQESSSVAYALTGRPADGTKKGIYIKNGKKVLVK